MTAGSLALLTATLLPIVGSTAAPHYDPDLAPYLSERLGTVPPSLVLVAEHDVLADEDVELATTIAPWVAYAVNHASEAASAVDDTANMAAAMATRAGIEQAKGILMERHRLTADQAFNLLTKASQHTGVKLRAVAEELVRTGALPGAR